MAPDRNGVDTLERELRRVVDRLSHLSLDRLAQPAPPWPTRAAGARATAQLLADLAQDVEEGRGPVPPGRRRRLPELADRAAADALAVTGSDLLRAVATAGGDRGDRGDAAGGDALDAARRGAEALAALRRAV